MFSQDDGKRIILGIDPGTARMGCCILEYRLKQSKGVNNASTLAQDHEVRLIESILIETSSELTAPVRLKLLYNKLTQIVKEYRPNTMVIERIFFNTNVTTAMSVGQARGVALLVSAQKNMAVFEYTALEAKMVVTGYGRSDKKQMQEGVRKFLKLKEKIKSDDANDAVAMALCHVKKHHGFAIFTGTPPVQPVKKKSTAKKVRVK